MRVAWTVLLGTLVHFIKGVDPELKELLEQISLLNEKSQLTSDDVIIKKIYCGQLKSRAVYELYASYCEDNKSETFSSSSQAVGTEELTDNSSPIGHWFSTVSLHTGASDPGTSVSSSQSSSTPTEASTDVSTWDSSNISTETTVTLDDSTPDTRQATDTTDTDSNYTTTGLTDVTNETSSWTDSRTETSDVTETLRTDSTISFETSTSDTAMSTASSTITSVMPTVESSTDSFEGDSSTEHDYSVEGGTESSISTGSSWYRKDDVSTNGNGELVTFTEATSWTGTATSTATTSETPADLILTTFASPPVSTETVSTSPDSLSIGTKPSRSTTFTEQPSLITSTVAAVESKTTTTGTTQTAQTSSSGNDLIKEETSTYAASEGGAYTRDSTESALTESELIKADSTWATINPSESNNDERFSIPTSVPDHTPKDGKNGHSTRMTPPGLSQVTGSTVSPVFNSSTTEKDPSFASSAHILETGSPSSPNTVASSPSNSVPGSVSTTPDSRTMATGYPSSPIPGSFPPSSPIPIVPGSSLSTPTSRSVSIIQPNSTSPTTPEPRDTSSALITTSAPSNCKSNCEGKIIRTSAQTFPNCTVVISTTVEYKNKSVGQILKSVHRECQTIFETERTNMILPGGSKIVSELAVAFDNCTLLIKQKVESIYGSRRTNENWFENSCYSTTVYELPFTTTNGRTTAGPTGTTEKDGGDSTLKPMKVSVKILAVKAISLPNCTVLITQTVQHENGTVSDITKTYVQKCGNNLSVSYADKNVTLSDGGRLLSFTGISYENCSLTITSKIQYPNRISNPTTWYNNPCDLGSSSSLTSTISGETSTILVGTSATPKPIPPISATPTTNIAHQNDFTTFTNGITHLDAFSVSVSMTSESSPSTASGSTSPPSTPIRHCPVHSLQNDSANTILINTTAMVHMCKSGYVFSDGARSKMFECVNGVWKGLNNATCKPNSCPPLSISLKNSRSPQPEDSVMTSRQPIGTMVVHSCFARHVFPTGEPMRIYDCVAGGVWKGKVNFDECQHVEL